MNFNFNGLRKTLFPGKITQVQVDGVNAILAACTKHLITDKRQVAYILATAFHESRFKPIEENGKGQGRPYGKMLDLVNGKLVPYTTPNQLYYGRGFVQLTWKGNYTTFGHLLGIDLVNHPELALQNNYAAEIMVLGMQKGIFTGVSLSHYFNANTTDSFGARKIINGEDEATLIQGYYNLILPNLS